MKANNPLEVTYSDITGPIAPIAKDGFEYVITVDEYFRCNFCYCLKQKSDIHS